MSDLTTLRPGDRVRVNAAHLGNEYIDKAATVSVCPLNYYGAPNKGQFTHEQMHLGAMTTYIFVLPDEKRSFINDKEKGYWVRADCVEKIFPEWVTAAVDMMMVENNVDCTPEFEPDVDSMIDDITDLAMSLRDNGFDVDITVTYPAVPRKVVTL